MNPFNHSSENHLPKSKFEGKKYDEISQVLGISARLKRNSGINHELEHTLLSFTLKN